MEERKWEYKYLIQQFFSGTKIVVTGNGKILLVLVQTTDILVPEEP